MFREYKEMFQSNRFTSHNPQQRDSYQLDSWQTLATQVAYRFNRQYQGETFELPIEVKAMPIFREWDTGTLSGKIASPFWEIARPQKNQRCLDIGCGFSFLIYPWREWEAFFYGQEISIVARNVLKARGPQLNSKLFKGVELGPAHHLNYSSPQFDLAIATGWSCYFPLDYWNAVVSEVKRVLKPGGQFVFDILDPDKPLAEDWAVLETYLGAEVFLEPVTAWEKTMKAAGAEVVSRRPGDLFELYKVRF
jgi:SAM-dependent methyltransferase